MKKLLIVLVVMIGVTQVIHGQRFFRSQCGNLQWNNNFMYQPVLYNSWVQPRHNWNFGFYGGWSIINNRFANNSFWWGRQTYIMPCQQWQWVWDPYWGHQRRLIWTQCVYWL